MKRLCSLVFAWRVAILACGLAMLMPQAVEGVDPQKKATPSSSRMHSEAFRALEPEERLKLVEKLAGAKVPLASAKRGDLVATVIERGVIESSDYTDVFCKVKPRGKDPSIATVILWVIDEGSIVKKGDLIARLDDSALRDLLVDATLRVKVAEDAVEKATDNTRLVQRENAIEVRLAEINVKLAELELKDAPQGKSKEALELRVERAKLLHERAQSRAKAQQAQVEAEKRAKETAKEMEAERLVEIRAQLDHCRLIAPRDGFVVYPAPPPGRFGALSTLIAPGESVREGQRLLRVTPLKQFAFNALVPESQVAALRVGQQTQVSVDAMPDNSLRGKVTRVSLIAEPFLRQGTDAKLYPVTIAIEEPPSGLKPGMTGVVEIPIGERKNVLLVPRKAVVTIDGDQVCYVQTEQGLEEKMVIVGAGNASSVEIKMGLKEGEKVLAELVLTPRESVKTKK